MCDPQPAGARMTHGGLAMASPYGVASGHAIVNINWKFCRIRVHQ